MEKDLKNVKDIFIDFVLALIVIEQAIEINTLYIANYA